MLAMVLVLVLLVVGVGVVVVVVVQTPSYIGVYIRLGIFSYGKGMFDHVCSAMLCGDVDDQ
jgi:hypothetical protein